MMPDNNLPTNSNLEDRLAEFADQVQARTKDQVETGAEPELLALEETVLRLRRAFPPKWMDEAVVRRVQAGIQPHARKAAERSGGRWRSRRVRQRIGLAFATVAIATLLLVFSPWIGGAGSAGTATAITPTQAALAGSAIAGLALFILWFRNRR